MPPLKPKEFKKAYNVPSLSYAQANSLINKIPLEQKKELLKALEIVNKWCGVSMRDEYLIKTLQYKIINN
jgi:hypothetical protein